MAFPKPTTVFVLDGRAIDKDYQTILEDHLHPGIQTLYTKCGTMYQDNNSAMHTARLVTLMSVLMNMKVRLEISHCTAQSLGLKYIEPFWAVS